VAPPSRSSSQIVDFFQQARTDPGLLRKLTGRSGRVLCELDPGVCLRYRVEFDDGTVKTCVLLAHGYPVIFLPPDTHGAPNRAMDPVMTQLLLAACGLPNGHTSLQKMPVPTSTMTSLASSSIRLPVSGDRTASAFTEASKPADSEDHMIVADE